jgi:hypothetical protein
VFSVLLTRDCLFFGNDRGAVPQRICHLLLVNGYLLFSSLWLGVLIDAAKLTNRVLFNLTPNNK